MIGKIGMTSRDWLLEDNEKVWQNGMNKAIDKWIEQYGPLCPVCHWPINHPEVQRVPHPGQTHDCYTGDPLAR
jgi:hypothetical protein